MATIAMLCAAALILVALVRIPIVLFLKYDPKDIVIVLGGFIYGPMTSALISLIVSFIEMVTISSDGILGFIMNVIAGVSFSCPAAFIYKAHPCGILRSVDWCNYGLCGYVVVELHQCTYFLESASRNRGAPLTTVLV